MAGINPDIIAKVQSKVDQDVAQLDGEQLKEKILAGLKTQAESSSLFESFPSGKDDYDACISYIEEVSSDELLSIEEVSEDIKGRVAAAQESWEELFYGVTSVSRSQGGRRMFFNEWASTLHGDGYGMAKVASLTDEGAEPRDVVSAVSEGMLAWSRREMPQGSHAQGSRVYPNSEVLDSDIGYDMEKNAMEVGAMEDMIREKMSLVMAALSTLSEYRVQLSAMLDPDSGDVDDKSSDEDQEFYGHA